MDGRKKKIGYYPEKISPEEYRQEWAFYLEHPDLNRRNVIAEWNFGLVYFFVERIRPKTPDWIETEDLIGYGMIGLLEALDRYRPIGEGSFAAYAVPRIMGSIRDGLRICEGLPRFCRGTQKKFDGVYEVLCQELQREPRAEEMTSRLKMSEQEYGQIQRWLCWNQASSYEEQFSEEESGDWTQKAEWECMKPQLYAALKDLPEEWNRLLCAIYMEEKSYRTISREWKKSKSTIAELHKKALGELRKKLL